jgi:two-component system, cell cycle sensor histidine kinase and response regulator CckA
MAEPDLQKILAAHLAESPYNCAISRLEDRKIVYANDIARQILKDNFGVDDPVGRVIWELDDAAKARWDEIADFAREPRGFIEREDFHVNGEHRAELVSTNVIEVDGVEYVCGIVVDISSTLGPEKELASALKRLEDAQSLAHFGDFVMDLSESTFDGSAKAMRILGLQGPGKITFTELFQKIHPDDLDSVLELANAQLPLQRFELEHRLAADTNGTETWVFTRITPEPEKPGNLVRGTIQDISERKQNEAERARLQAKTLDSQRLESLGVLAGGIAHDFNNLLAGIMGNADFALTEANIPLEVRDCLEDIVTASRRAADLTHQLLAYSGKGRFVIEDVDLSQMVREMSDLVAVTVGRDHPLRMSLASELPSVEVDSTQIRQVIMNLIINAGEAMDGSLGGISITTGTQHCDADYLTSAELSSEISPGDYVFLEVSDTGTGMDQDTQARIFDPFFTTKFTGRGLGLTAALGIIRGHLGAIKIYSEIDKGTTFKVMLPVSGWPLQQEDNAKDKPDLQGTGSVLIIDDDQTVRDFAAKVLRQRGYEVVLAKDGEEGLALFREHDGFDVVLLDLTMPNMSGRETFANLRVLRPDVHTDERL